MKTETENTTPESGQVERLVRWLRRYGWALWIGGCLAAADWHWLTWQFYVVFIPLSLLIGVHDEAI